MKLITCEFNMDSGCVELRFDDGTELDINCTVLLRRRFDTASNLATEFHVSVRTMQNDLHELMLSHPIESVRGRYGGGYKVADWYHPQLHTLCAEQIKVLKKAASLVSAEDQLVIRTILEQFAP